MRHSDRRSESNGLADGEDATITAPWEGFASMHDAGPAPKAAQRSWGMWFWLGLFSLAIGGGWKYDLESRQIAADALSQREQMDELSNNRFVRAIAFSADGKLMASADADGLVCLWDVASRSVQFALRGHSDSVWTLAFSPDGQTLASGGGNWPHESGELLLWDTTSGGLKYRLLQSAAPVSKVAFTPDGRMLMACCGYGPLRLWNARAWTQLPALASQFQVVTFAIAPDGHTLAIATLDHHVHVLDLRDGKCDATISESTYSVPALAFAPDGAKLISGSVDGALHYWDLGTPRNRCPWREIVGRLPIRAVAFSPDNCWLALGCGWWRKPGLIRIWDLTAWEERAVLHEPMDGVFGVAFTPDSKTLASGSNNHIVRLWDMVTCTQRTELRANEADVCRTAR